MVADDGGPDHARAGDGAERGAHLGCAAAPGPEWCPPSWPRRRRRRDRPGRAPTARRASGHGPATAPTRRRPADPPARLPHVLLISRPRRAAQRRGVVRCGRGEPVHVGHQHRDLRARLVAGVEHPAFARHGPVPRRPDRRVHARRHPVLVGERADDLQRRRHRNPRVADGQRRVRPPREPAGARSRQAPSGRSTRAGQASAQRFSTRATAAHDARRGTGGGIARTATTSDRATRTAPRRVCTTSAPSSVARSPTASVSRPDPSRCRSATRCPTRSSSPSTVPILRPARPG